MMRLSRGPTFWAISILAWLGSVLVGASLAKAQDLEATLTYTRTNADNRFTLVVLNSSPAETIDAVTVSMQDGLQFDTASGNPSPDVGVNNDDNKSTTLTWARTLTNGDLLQVSGDVDGPALPQEIIATLNFTSAGARTVTLQPSGVTDQWQAIVSETTGPPAPIIDGQAVATLTWARPTEYEDGTALPVAKITGYAIFWGEQSGVGRCGITPISTLDPCYGSALELTDGALETTQLTLSLTGDVSIFFAMAAYTTDELGSQSLSRYSNEARRDFTVVVTEPPEIPPAAPVLIDVAVTVTCTTDQPGVTCNVIVQ